MAVAVAAAAAVTTAMAVTVTVTEPLALTVAAPAALAMCVIGTMGVGMSMAVSMAMAAAPDALGGCGIPQIGAHRRYGILARCLRHTEALGGHALREALSETAGDDHVHLIQWMCATAEIVQGHVLGQIQAVHLARLAILANLIDKEAARAPGMGRDGAKVLTGDGNLHGGWLLWIHTDILNTRFQ